MNPQAPAQRPPLSTLLDISEVAAILHVSDRHVRRLVFERRIPYIKWGRLLRFDPVDIGRWLDAARQPQR
jgi:excisionase family DNA binding protein